MSKKISIIIPFFNEEENIGELFKYLDMNCRKNNIKPEIVFVDDGSVDNSLNILRTLKPNFFDAKIIKLAKNYGSHNAIRAGIMSSSNDICVFFSADMQEPFEVIIRMLDKIEDGYDIIAAYKEEVKIGIIEKVFSRTYSSLIRKFAVNDFPLEGVNNIMFNKKVKDVLNSNVEINSSIFLQIINMGFKKTFIPYSLIERKRGKSKWTLSKKIKLFLDSFINFSYVPIRLVTICGFVFSFISIISTIVIIINKIFINTNMPLGFPTLIIVILLGFGITNISIGIVAEYIWRNLDLAKNRPAFLIDEIYNL